MKKIRDIYIVAKGPTASKCPDRNSGVGIDDEIWGLNSVYMSRNDLDSLFIMHDVRTVIIAEDRDFINNANNVDTKIYTTIPVKVLKNNVVFPVEKVVNSFGVSYFMNCICWMIAYAILQNPRHIYLYGADFVYGVDINEKACTEWWLGVAFGRGIGISISEGSALLKPPELVQPFYGFIVSKKEAGLNGLNLDIRPNLVYGDGEVCNEYELVPKRKAKEVGGTSVPVNHEEAVNEV